MSWLILYCRYAVPNPTRLYICTRQSLTAPGFYFWFFCCCIICWNFFLIHTIKDCRLFVLFSFSTRTSISGTGGSQSETECKNVLLSHCLTNLSQKWTFRRLKNIYSTNFHKPYLILSAHLVVTGCRINCVKQIIVVLQKQKSIPV